MVARRLALTAFTACGPLLATAAIAWAVMAGPLDLGAGEKDILLVVPLALWSLAFMGAVLVLRARGVALPRASRRAALLSTVLLAALYIALLGLTWR